MYYNDLRCLAVGQVTHDDYDGVTRAGGCAFYAGRVFDALGAESLLLTTLGKDFGCTRELFGLEVALARSEKTPRFTNRYQDDGRRIQWMENEVAEVGPWLLPPAYVSCDVLLLAPVLGEVDLRKWKGRVNARITGITVQGFVKQKEPSCGSSSASACRVMPRSYLKSLKDLGGVDAAFLSHEDLEGQEGLLDHLRSHVPVVVLTDGVRGSVVFTGDRFAHVGVYPASVVDPTGAGDTYAAAFLVRLAESKDPVESARFAAAASSIVIEGQGAETATMKRMNESCSRAAFVPVWAEGTRAVA